MGAPIKYHPGDVFNFWTLIRFDFDKNRWLAKCICGKEKYIWISHLVLNAVNFNLKPLSTEPADISRFSLTSYNKNDTLQDGFHAKNTLW